MNFKEALIAHLRGEKVQVKKFSEWQAFEKWVCDHVTLKDSLADDFANACQFRIAPRTILVNGVEVPAPEQAAPDYGATHYVPMPSWADFYAERRWDTSDDHIHSLKCGLVYLNKDDAINRAKAMLITQEAV